MSNGTIVVVGDGGVLSWGLAYYLRRKWSHVVVVGDETSPRESMMTSANIDVEPRRVGHYMTLRNIKQHAWFGLLHGLFDTAQPPQNYEFNGWLSLLTNPLLYSYAARMLFRTRETTLDGYDIPQVALHRNSNQLFSDLQKQLPALKSSPAIVSDTVSSLFFENQSFSDQRNRLVRLKRAGIESSHVMSTGDTTGERYPTLFSVRQWIRKDIEYNFPVVNLSVLTRELKAFCLSKNVSTNPVAVSSFVTKDGAIAEVQTTDGKVIPCDAVVLASGYDTIRLLFKAGFYGCVPPLMRVTNYGIDVDNSDQLSLIPKRSFTVENGLGFLRGKETTAVTGLHTFGSPTCGTLPTYEPITKETDEGTFNEVVDRFRVQLDRFINVPLNPWSVQSVTVDESTVTPDSLPIIGKLQTEGKRLPRPSNVFVCCGLGLSGGYAALSAAKLTSDLSTGDTTDVPPEPYLPSRFYLSS